MLCAYEVILFTWLHLYGYLLSRAGQSRFGRRIQVWLQGVTGGVLLALGAKLAFEQKV
jgi:threonine/homoserine/homoserine lactone efflux protein